MVVKMVALDMPSLIAAGLESGIYTRDGGTIRDAVTGVIVKLLPEAKMPTLKIDGAFSRLSTGAFSRLSKGSTGSLLIGLGVAAVTLVAAGVALKMADNAEKVGRDALLEYNSALNAYLVAIQAGTLTTESLDQFVAALDAVDDLSTSGKFTIEFSPEDSEALLKVVYEYTLEFAEANSIEFSGIVAPTPDSVATTIDELRQYLLLQKEVFTRSA